MGRYAIVGFGCAGYQAAVGLRANDQKAEIHVFSETDAPPANPMLTTWYVKGLIPRERLFPFGSLEDISKTLNIRFHGGQRVEALLAAEKKLKTPAGITESFDAILLATGAETFVPPVPGIDHPRVAQMRTVADADRLKDMLAGNRPGKALIVGASMTGIKVAEIFESLGADCVMADQAEWIFPMAALEPIGRRIMARLQARGVAMRFGLALERIIPAEDGLTACFKGGENIKADLVALCVGAKARTDLAREAGLECGRGIRADAAMRSSQPGIYVAGDCCEAGELQSGQPMVIGLWANAALQGRVAGRNMAGGRVWGPPGVLQNISHFFGMDFIGVGGVDPGKADIRIFENDEYFIAAAQKEGRLSCLNILGPPHGGGVLKSRMLKALAGLKSDQAEQFGLLSRYGLPRDFLAFLDRD